MGLDEETVARVATLARIKVPEADRAALAAELRSILGWMERLNAVDTTGVAPMARVVSMKLPMREDRVDDGGDAAAVLANGPGASDGFFVVPKVVE
jgi:aspartyl-tRNA(Asn)/glutamyl-tRNA(Gln) amidotransferase subunit C